MVVKTKSSRVGRKHMKPTQLRRKGLVSGEILGALTVTEIVRDAGHLVINAVTSTSKPRSLKVTFGR